ncbi:MAG: hypothetical protein ABR607_08345, partial [Pyrinomonadaceae bacterium]
MSTEFNQSKYGRECENVLCSLYRSVLCRYFCVVLFASLLISPSLGRNQNRQPAPTEKRIHYNIKLALNFDERTYTGSEQVHWVNRGDHATSTIFFHLYPNMRPPDYVAPSQKNELGQLIADEPKLEISEVRAVTNNALIPFSFDDLQTTLRINLREAVQPGAAVDVQIKFKGSVPEIDPEETGIVTHVLQQVSAAIRSEREVRRARDTNFTCRGVMMLATSFPILAARSGEDWLRKIEPSIGDWLTTDAADFDVTIEAAPGLMIFTPVVATELTHKEKIDSQHFAAETMRDFAILAGRNLKSEE